MSLDRPARRAMTHTRSLRSSRRERLYFRVFGRWPQSYVDRRLEALWLDQRHLFDKGRGRPTL